MNTTKHSKVSMPVLIFAAVILAAFFMPWFQLFGLGVSGYQLGRLGSYGNYAWVIPILSGGTILLSLAFPESDNRPLGALAGIIPLGAILYGLLRLASETGGKEVSSLFEVAQNVLSIGVYVTIIGCVGIVLAALHVDREG